MPLDAKALSAVEFDRPDRKWQPYRRLHDRDVPGRPSHATECAKAFAQLNQIVHETINVYCGSRGPVSATSILRLYAKFMDWRRELPESLRNTSGDAQNALPHVFTLQ